MTASAECGAGKMIRRVYALNERAVRSICIIPISKDFRSILNRSANRDSQTHTHRYTRNNVTGCD